MGEENPARHDAELAPIVQHAKAQLVSKIPLLTWKSRKRTTYMYLISILDN